MTCCCAIYRTLHVSYQSFHELAFLLHSSFHIWFFRGCFPGYWRWLHKKGKTEEGEMVDGWMEKKQTSAKLSSSGSIPTPTSAAKSSSLPHNLVPNRTLRRSIASSSWTLNFFFFGPLSLAKPFRTTALAHAHAAKDSREAQRER